MKKVDNSHTDDVQHSTPYLYNQLKNILCKDSTTASVEKKIHHNQGEIVHRNAIESQKLQKNLKSKCKRVAYKFVKGLLKERKLKNPDDIDENEHIYFEVSFIALIAYSLYFIYVPESRTVYTLHICICFLKVRQESKAQKKNYEKCKISNETHLFGDTTRPPISVEYFYSRKPF